MMEPIRPKGSRGFTTTPPPDRYLSVQNVAEALGCMDKFVYDLIQEGNLKAIKIGVRALRISEQSLRAFIAARVVNPADYLTPEEPPSRKPEPQKPKAARSNWMSR
jgi:excisionase family DNA binding protein